MKIGTFRFIGKIAMRVHHVNKFFCDTTHTHTHHSHICLINIYAKQKIGENAEKTFNRTFLATFKTKDNYTNITEISALNVNYVQCGISTLFGARTSMD